jgi:hypothetical protein
MCVLFLMASWRAGVGEGSEGLSTRGSSVRARPPGAQAVGEGSEGWSLDGRSSAGGQTHVRR